MQVAEKRQGLEIASMHDHSSTRRHLQVAPQVAVALMEAPGVQEQGIQIPADNCMTATSDKATEYANSRRGLSRDRCQEHNVKDIIVDADYEDGQPEPWNLRLTRARSRAVRDWPSLVKNS